MCMACNRQWWGLCCWVGLVGIWVGPEWVGVRVGLMGGVCDGRGLGKMGGV